MNGDEYTSQDPLYEHPSQDEYGEYHITQPESSDDLQVNDFLQEDISNAFLADWPSEARFLENYQSPAVEQLQSESDISSSFSLTDILGKVIDIAGKTASDVYKIKYAQPVLKAVPAVQSGLEKSLFYPLAQTRQTGLGTTTFFSSLERLPASLGLPASVAGIPTSYLIIGAILILLVGLPK